MNRTANILLYAVFLAAIGIGAAPRFLEELAIGGGYGDTDGGAWHEKDGDILTDGLITADTGIHAGTDAGDHGISITAGASNDAYLNLYQADTNNGGALWFDGSAGVLALGTRDGAATVTNAVQIQKGSQNAAIVGDLDVLNGVCNIGQSSALRGTLHAWGNNASLGGVINLWNGDNDDTFSDRWLIFAESGSGNFTVRGVAGTSGTTEDVLEVDDATHDLTVTKDLSVLGGDFAAGTDTTTRGVITAWDGSGGAAPGCIRLASPNGTAWYLFVEDDGTVKLTSSLPTQNSDGTAVGIQF